jgi:deazaflavin-dependent oxidoreductase (nitroreductase family)
MDEAVQRAMERDRTIDITTTGRKTRQPRRKEIWFHNVEGHLYITGTPGRRDWYANLLAHPEFTFHLKQSVRADLPSQLGPLPSWIRSDDERSWLRFTRNSAAREIWRRGSREAPWWKWNSLVRKRAAPAFERLWGTSGQTDMPATWPVSSVSIPGGSHAAVRRSRKRNVRQCQAG